MMSATAIYHDCDELTQEEDLVLHIRGRFELELLDASFEVVPPVF